MITKIIIENFFSFGEKTIIVLNPDINILVGINGSGKSNFIKAIQLLQESIVGKGFEKIFLKDWSGFDAVANVSRTEKEYIRLTYEFDKNAINSAVNDKGYHFQSNPVYELTIFPSGGTSYYLKEKLFLSDNTKETPLVFLDIKNTKGVITTREEEKVQFKPDRTLNFKSSELVLRQISDPDRYYPLFTLKRALEECSVYNYFDTTLKSEIRQPATYGTEDKLLSNGFNLMSILNKIKNNHAFSYDEIEKTLRKVNPFFKDITFDFLVSKLYLVLREEQLTRTISIEHISDGTLRFLLLLSVLYNPKRGNLICIDEPEISFHPDMIHTVAEAIKKSARAHVQFIIATHSPLFLNAFDLEQLLIFEKNENNETVVVKKSEDDFEKWNEEYLSGQLWLQGLIGGKRW